MIPRPLDSPRKLIRREPLKHDRVVGSDRLSLERPRALTVCIAGIAEGGRAIVMLADRALSATRNNRTILKSDSRIKKIQEIAPGWWALFSGRPDFARTVLEWAKVNYHTANPPSVPECVKLAYQSVRRVEIIDNVFQPSLHTENWYKERLHTKISVNDECFFRIFDKVENHDCETSLMACGFDEHQMAQIYVIRNPGKQEIWSPDGFGVIGIGGETARNRLYVLNNNVDNKLTRVLYNMYDAKELCASILPDVGHEWDALVLMDGKNAEPVPPDKMRLIEKLYKYHPKSPFDDASRPELSE
jgi:hypothetical protein